MGLSDETSTSVNMITSADTYQSARVHWLTRARWLTVENSQEETLD